MLKWRLKPDADPWKQSRNLFSYHELLLVRFLSLSGCVSLCLFLQFVLLGHSRDSVSWASAMDSSSSGSALQQTAGTGNASRVNVWVWNKGEQTNRALTASWSSRFLCSGESSESEAADRHRVLTHRQKPSENYQTCLSSYRYLFMSIFGNKTSQWQSPESRLELQLLIR